jgi:glycosyltransferase involved in cell wall biosynthesis
MAVSVVIATLNRRIQLEYTLNMLREQVSADDEIVIVDDGSDPVDAEFFRTVELPCHKVVVRHDVNKGRFPAKNEGIMAAKHECIVQLDNDAWLVEKDSLRILEQLLAENPRVGALAVPMHFHFSEAPDECGSLARRWSFGEMQRESIYMGCGVALRRSAVIEAGMYPEFYVYGPEEEALAVRLLKVGFEVRGTRRVRCIHGHSVLCANPGYVKTRDAKPDLDVASNQLCIAAESLAWPISPLYQEWVFLKAAKKGLKRSQVMEEYRRKSAFLDTGRFRLPLGATLYWCLLRAYVYSRNRFNLIALRRQMPVR